MHGWWIYVGTSAVSLLSKHVIQIKGRHIFNPSNFGLVLCFLALGPARAEPLDFWWGPMSAWLVLAFAIIVGGAIVILSRLKLFILAAGFWVAFAIAVAALVATGHTIIARWHLGPIGGAYLWRVLLTSPEILVFLFFMITDPRTTPSGRRARLAYGAGVGLLAALMIAPLQTEHATKVAILASLTIVCAARPLVERLPLERAQPRRLVLFGVTAFAVYAAARVTGGLVWRTPAVATAASASGRLPEIAILPSRGVDSTLNRATSREIAADVLADLRAETAALKARHAESLANATIGDERHALERQVSAAATRTIEVPSYDVNRIRLHLEAGDGQGPVIAVAALDGTVQVTTYKDEPPTLFRRASPVALHETVELEQHDGRWIVAHVRSGRPVAFVPLVHAVAKGFDGVRLTDVAQQAGLDFTQGDFRLGWSNDVHGMMGGGLCWLDYNGDGKLDLFVVNS